ncbi:MAG: aconitase X [Arenicellales bacterium WSBS_2016_MAG_OTU3]
MLDLTQQEQDMLHNEAEPAKAMALRIVLESGRLLGATRLVPIVSAHADGCIYYGDAGVFFTEKLVALGAKVAVPTTLNVGALDLLHPNLVKGGDHHHQMSKRLMDAHVTLGCQQTWSCAPYQTGHRPEKGAQVAWGESNAIAFVNSVLGARTNRYGDFLDLCCAITARAPYYGLHITENRAATIVVDTAELSTTLKRLDAFYPVLGAWLGANVGTEVAVVTGLPADVSEDSLKAVGAGAASKGAVGLFHIAGVTPEAATLNDALQGQTPKQTIRLTAAIVAAARDDLSQVEDGRIDCVAFGSPHFSYPECMALLALAGARAFKIPVYLCTNKLVMDKLEQQGAVQQLENLGVQFVVGTCIAVTPVLKRMDAGVMMTNSAKFAHYGIATTGYHSVFGSLSDCLASARAGRVQRDAGQWQ